MGFFGSEGQFGGWLQNPQIGGGVDQTGFWGNSANSGPINTDMGPFGGHYVPGKGWNNIAGFSTPEKQFEMMLGRRNRLARDDDQLKKKYGKKFDFGGLLGAARDAGIKGGNVPDEWDQESANVPENSINTLDVINAAKPKIMEEMQRAMAAGAARMGKTGAMMGSGYTKELGKAARNAGNDIASKTLDTLFSAGEAQAGREHEAQQRGYDRSLDSWGKHGDWEFEAGREYWDRIPMLMNLMTTLDGGGYNFDPNDIQMAF